MVKSKFKNAIEMLYDGICDIFRSVIEESESGISYERREKVYEGIKCRISYESSKSAQKSETITTASQSIKLFLPLGYEIKNGDMVFITQNGISEKYKLCGKVSVYKNHQECILEIFDESV